MTFEAKDLRTARKILGAVAAVMGNPTADRSSALDRKIALFDALLGESEYVSTADLSAETGATPEQLAACINAANRAADEPLVTVVRKHGWSKYKIANRRLALAARAKWRKQK